MPDIDNKNGGTRDGENAQASLRVVGEVLDAMFWVGNPLGSCEFVNQKWFDYTGADGGGALFDLIHPEDLAVFKQGWQQAGESRQPYQTDLRLRRRDGVYHWHRVRCVSDDPTLKRWLITLADMDEETRIFRASSQTKAGLARAKEELERTVGERTQQLQEAVEQLEAFAYSIAHDMRAPLRAMHQYAETVARDFGPQVPAEGRAYLNKIMAASEKLDLLIREVLVYTRVSQGRLDLKSLSLERLLSDTLLAYPQLTAPNVELHARLPLHSVIGDETALTQAISNLLTNAVKFVPGDRKPEITVWTTLAGDNVRISVQDNGIGIRREDRKRIFKMFEKLHPDSKVEGSGIGLTIARRAVERMGGKLGVDSTEGRGSTFWIELRKGDL
jgi:signal transduction histidine kinase